MSDFSRRSFLAGAATARVLAGRRLSGMNGLSDQARSLVWRSNVVFRGGA